MCALPEVFSQLLFICYIATSSVKTKQDQNASLNHVLVFLNFAFDSNEYTSKSSFVRIRNFNSEIIQICVILYIERWTSWTIGVGQLARFEIGMPAYICDGILLSFRSPSLFYSCIFILGQSNNDDADDDDDVKLVQEKLCVCESNK